MSWLAVTGKSPEEILNAFGFQPTGIWEELPESALTAASLPGGWYVLVANREMQVVSDAAMASLSSHGAQLLSCFVEEHVMVSAASFWQQGRKTWSILHDSSIQKNHLVTEGDLPLEYRPIHQEMMGRQKQQNAIRKGGVDYIFEIPVTLAEKITGLSYCKTIPDSVENPFQVLVDKNPRQPPFWKKLFRS